MMRFAYFGLVSLLALALMPAVSFADIAAPPPSQVTVHLTSNGINETTTQEITFMCTPYPDNDTVEREIPMNCSAGTCTNEPQWMGSECAYFRRGYFSYAYQGQNRTSEALNNSGFYRYYEYRLDIQTGKLTLVSASNNPNPEPGPCTTVFILAAALLLVAFRRG